MADDKPKLSEHARQYITWGISIASVVLSIYVLFDNRAARRETQHPYIGIDDVYVEPDSRFEIVGGAFGKGTVTRPGSIYAVLRVYGNSPALITSYKIDCFSGEWMAGEDSYPQLTLLPGATKIFTCDRFYANGKKTNLDDPKTIAIWTLVKPIQIKLTFEYEDIFHRKETKGFCFSNQPTWDRKHLRPCEVPPPNAK